MKTILPAITAILLIGCTPVTLAAELTQETSPTLPTEAPTIESSLNETPTGIVYRQGQVDWNALEPHITMQENTQEVNGVAVTTSNFYAQNGHVFVKICYAMPEAERYWLGGLKLTGGSIWLSSANSQQLVNEPGRQCTGFDYFDVPEDADLENLTLIVDALVLTPPMEGTECETYLALLEAAPEAVGIEVECQPLQGQSPQLIVITKPASMSEDEANALVNQVALGIIKGPWTFTGSITP